MMGVRDGFGTDGTRDGGGGASASGGSGLARKVAAAKRAQPWLKWLEYVGWAAAIVVALLLAFGVGSGCSTSTWTYATQWPKDADEPLAEMRIEASAISAEGSLYFGAKLVGDAYLDCRLRAFGGAGRALSEYTTVGGRPGFRWGYDLPGEADILVATKVEIGGAVDCAGSIDVDLLETWLVTLTQAGPQVAAAD